MTDFLVIGGGVAGIAAAAHLAELGSVLLLEREDALGYHASGRSAAMFEEDYGPPAIKALSRASRAYLAAPGAERESYLSPRGLMLVGRADQRAGFETDLATLDLEEIPVAEARARVPILNPETLAFAATHETATDIDTDRLMGDWAKLLRQRGGRTLMRQEVIAITRLEAGWRVETRNDSFDARQLVNAAGAWADIIAEMAGVAPVGLQPKRRSMAQLPAPEGHDVNGWPMLMGVHEAWYAKPQAGKLLVSPADADPVPPQDAWADDMVLAEGLARYEEMVTTPVTRLETSWAGLRSFAPDGVPVFGEDPAQAGFWWYAGQGGYGFQSAPASARLLRALVACDTPEISADIVRTLCPGRFR
ncbi:NAD(P)/FAD-dependent oxidoreductase [Tritonibacter mobilis]|uniref:NAD(P)/FAD-dependent oxidoreductase n=1 Tax=Tritonibacter mobilis TaxID=379347 RepID=UPI000806BB7D|nr:FAD-dependent oxidoreductase [Tritonibacter mobilis]GLP86006.1 glycerol-3-phosphate dehydrogenase [Tritonibacter mobilis]SDW97078.1 Glycine/D-amino acid oxidase [Tritonibacter mobilis]